MQKVSASTEEVGGLSRNIITGNWRKRIGRVGAGHVKIGQGDCREEKNSLTG